jgi:hypothetical protein
VNLSTAVAFAPILIGFVMVADLTEVTVNPPAIPAFYISERILLLKLSGELILFNLDVFHR